MIHTFSHIVQSLIRQLSSTEGRVATRDLLHEPRIPEVVRGFVAMELEIAFATDIADLRAHFVLAPSYEENLYQTFFQAVGEHSTMSAADASSILLQSYDDALRYLTEPQSFILQLLADDATSVTLDAPFFLSLSYLREYSYLPAILRSWAERSAAEGVEVIRTEQLRETIARIDRSVIGSYGADDLESLLAPIYLLLQSGSASKELLQRFFYDKGATVVVRALRDDSRTALTLSELVDLLLVLMHGAQDGGMPSGGKQPTTGSPEYQQFLDELQAAGVLLAPPVAADVVRQAARTRDSERTGGRHENPASQPNPSA